MYIFLQPAFIYPLLVVAAWGSLLLPLPRWASALLSFVLVAVGLILFLFGFLGTYWSSHMTPDSNPAMSMLVTGLLLLLSRAALVLELVLNILFSPPVR